MGKKEVRSVGSSGAVGAPGHMGTASAIEAAMSAAIEDAQAKGVTDPEKLRALMLAARKAILEIDRK